VADIVQERPGAQQFPPNTIDEAKRQRLLELVRGRAMARPTDLAEDEVMVWPSLVVVEAVCAAVFLLLTVLLSVLVSAPLTAHANPNQTPNPSKAPWYFLNLQELLLHMAPGLAGVVIPTIALLGIAAIPYIDRSPLGVGILGSSAKGRKIIGFSFVWVTVVLVASIYLNELSGRTVFGLTPIVRSLGGGEFIYNWVLPTLFILINIAIFGGAVRQIFRPTTREMVIAMFTAFVAAYVVLTLSGTSFRGEGQNLTWPWNLPLEHH
jgi:quinol-cytochrome oxidoreductase complex cytochrome b subunit